ncbi:MAG: tyrosine--tRNA ligase [Candidatus Sungbacteria bacterium]|nr:tyrosine--tRNA ligase [Candidatus Sungbacteria bacterium]
MESKVDKKAAGRILTERVEDVIERESLQKKLFSGKRLVVKLGADPSRPDLHLGHALVLRKLREFQDLGHRAVFIIGDFTAMIGDPSGKADSREPLTREEARANAETYFDQVGKIVDLEKAEVRYNSEWFSKMDLAAFLPIAANFSLRRIMDREDFQKRIRAGGEVGLHEGFYQVFQAYDSVVVKADVELGGRDQLVNMLAGRELQKKVGQPPQDIVIAPLLVGLDGKQKMSKSLKNYIALTDNPREMFGKVMSVPDSLIFQYAELAAFFDEKGLKEAASLVKKAPLAAKQDVASRIVGLYWGEGAATEARRAFEARFSRHGKGGGAYEERTGFSGFSNLNDVVLLLGGARSNSEARRLISGGAVEVDGVVIKDPKNRIDFSKAHRFRIGKKGFFKTVPQ